MEQKQIAEYKDKLEKEKRLLLVEIRNNEKPVDVGADTEDPDEETDKSELMGDQLAVANDLRTRLTDIDAALEKIRIGKYGICEKCDKPIEKEILDIDPESRFCKHHKLEK
jgi:DnaK suppressor protein